MKKKILLCVLLILSLTLALSVTANAETTVTTFDDIYVGEYTSATHSGMAHIVFGQVSDTESEYGIIVEDENGAKRLFKGQHIGEEGKFGIALYNLPEGNYKVCAYEGKEGNRTLGDTVSFIAYEDSESQYTVEYYKETLKDTDIIRLSFKEGDYGGYFGSKEKIAISSGESVYMEFDIHKAVIPQTNYNLFVVPTTYNLNANTTDYVDSGHSRMLVNNFNFIFGVNGGANNINPANNNFYMEISDYSIYKTTSSGESLVDGMTYCMNGMQFEERIISNYERIDSETEIKQGTTDTTANATIKDFENFALNEEKSTISGNIAGDGSLVLKVYYDISGFLVRFNGNGGNLVSGNPNQIVEHGGTVTAPTFEKEGYTFVGWDTDFSSVTSDLKVNAVWKANQYTITIVYGNGQEDKIITQDYNSAIEDIANPEREGYVFVGWDKTIPAKMPAENIIINAEWAEVFNVSNGTITSLTQKGTTLSDIIIPSTIDGNDITSIGIETFANNTVIKSVTIAKSVTSIGSYAFSNCTSLDLIVFEGSEEEWNTVSKGDYWDQNVLAIVVYSVVEDWESVFLYSDGKIMGLTEYGKTVSNIIIPATLGGEKVTSIEGGVFYESEIIENVIIGNNVTYIGVHAFAYSSINNVMILDSVTTIDELAFYACVNLEKVIIGNGVETIGTSAFQNCESIIKLTMGNNVKHIGDSAFDLCMQLKEIIIPESVERIDMNAFNSCYALEEIIIPNNVTHIEGGAFQVCTSLKTITIGKNVEYIGDWALSVCTSLTSINFEGTTEEWSAISKGESWNYEVPATYVQCSDGRVDL